MRVGPVLHSLFVLLYVTTLHATGTAALNVPARYVLHESRSTIPHGWTLTKRLNETEYLPLRFGLRQSNMDKLDVMLMDVSDPASPNYGQHWTAERVAKTFAPSNETLDAVRGWLVDAGFGPARVRVSATRNWVRVNATVQEAERLLRTEYHVYTHKTGKRHVACETYHLPAHISPHIEIVTPSVHFDGVLKKRNNSTRSANHVGLPGVCISLQTSSTISTAFNDLKDCDQFITPICLRALYGLIYEPVAASRNSFGIVEYTPQAYVQSDLDMFARNFSSSLVGVSPQLVSVDGGIVQAFQTGYDMNAEPNLDLQYALALVNPSGHKQNVTLYQVGDLAQGASFNNFLDALDSSYCTFRGGDDPETDIIYPDSDYYGGYTQNDCGIAKPANVISTSYSYNEADLSPFYTARQCAEYAKLGLMGVTMIFSSGDNGVAGGWDLCLNADGSQSEDGRIFNPGFPATCPYVTSIGATQINPGKNVTDNESACQRGIFSGGGFSNHFAIPEYQKKAVDKYFQNHKITYADSIYNTTGSRGYPDVSANGANYLVAVNGGYSGISGTSAAAPVVAAILTLVNDARLAVGKRPIGFINPSIYSDLFADAFHDITDGRNPGCNTEGFAAVPGWDPVTGLGTPNFPKLLARWMLLP